MKAVTCTNHCGACGRHFHSLAAFDLHRTGDYGSNDPELGRRCLSPIEILDAGGEMRMVKLTEQGLCRAYEPAKAQIEVWTMAASLERARERWGVAA